MEFCGAGSITDLIKSTKGYSIREACYLLLPLLHLFLLSFILFSPFSFHSYNQVHPFIHSSIHLSTHLSIHPLIHPSIHSSIHPLIHLSTHSFIHLFTHPFIYLLIHPSIYSSIYSLIHPSIYSLIHPPIHPLIHPSTHLQEWIAYLCREILKGLDHLHSNKVPTVLAPLAPQ